MRRYQTVIADPPWQFGDRLPGASRGAAKNYDTLGTKGIQTFLADQCVELAPDCRLFLWRVASMQQEALDVMKAWGFCLKSEIVWRKQTATGKRWFGMGRTVRAEHETCLIGVRGRPEVLNHSTRSVFDAAVGRHSAKPEAFYAIVEGLSPGPYLELFARTRRVGWDAIGNELPEQAVMEMPL